MIIFFQINSVFTSSTNDFRLIDINKNDVISDGIRLHQESREIAYSSFSQPNVYYWSLPNKYLGDKISSYGGYLRYTIRNTPVPGGASSRKTAPDVELVSVSIRCSYKCVLEHIKRSLKLKLKISYVCLIDFLINY